MQPLQIPPHLNSKCHHDDDDDHQCINPPIKNENCAESEEKKRFVKMVQKWFIMLCKLANGNISENVILIRNTAGCSFFCPIGKCDWYCWPRTRETFFSTWPTHSCLYAAPHLLSHLDAPHPYIRVFMNRWLSNPNHAIFSQRRNFQFVLFFLVTVLFPSLFHPLIGRGLFHAKKPFSLSVHFTNFF